MNLTRFILFRICSALVFTQVIYAQDEFYNVYDYYEPNINNSREYGLKELKESVESKTHSSSNSKQSREGSKQDNEKLKKLISVREKRKIERVGDFGPTPYEHYLEKLPSSDPKTRKELDILEMKFKNHEMKLKELKSRSVKDK
jgi:hypothetical protein